MLLFVPIVILLLDSRSAVAGSKQKEEEARAAAAKKAAMENYKRQAMAENLEICLAEASRGALSSDSTCNKAWLTPEELERFTELEQVRLEAEARDDRLRAEEAVARAAAEKAALEGEAQKAQAENLERCLRCLSCGAGYCNRALLTPDEMVTAEANALERSKRAPERIVIVGTAKTRDMLAAESLDGWRKSNPEGFAAFAALVDVAESQAGTAAQISRAVGRYQASCTGSIVTEHEVVSDGRSTTSGGYVEEHSGTADLRNSKGKSVGSADYSGETSGQYIETTEWTEFHTWTSETDLGSTPECKVLATDIDFMIKRVEIALLPTIRKAVIEGVEPQRVEWTLGQFGIPYLPRWR